MDQLNNNSPQAEINTIFTGYANPSDQDIAENNPSQRAAALALADLLPGNYVMYSQDTDFPRSDVDVDEWARGCINSEISLCLDNWGNGVTVVSTNHGPGFVVDYGGCPLASAASLYFLPQACLGE